MPLPETLSIRPQTLNMWWESGMKGEFCDSGAAKTRHGICKNGSEPVAFKFLTVTT
jgi:hypothetical protein